MKRTNLVNKSVKLLMSVIIASSIVAMGSNGTVAATLTNNDAIISSIVMAAETTMFTGTYNYVQNDAGNPEPAVVVQPDGSVAVALFQGTMIQLNSSVGVVPQILAGTDVAASVVVPEGNGILIAGNAVGSGVIQVQNTANGTISNIVVNVVASSSTPATSTTPVTSASTHKGVQNGFYSYADDHKIVSTDGCLEVILDGMQFDNDYTHKDPIVYFGEDGMLTVELYQGQWVKMKANSLLDGYYFAGTTDGSMIIGGSQKKGSAVRQCSIQAGGRGTDIIKHESTQLPIRLIGLGGVYDEGAGQIRGGRPWQPLSLTTK